LAVLRFLPVKGREDNKLRFLEMSTPNSPKKRGRKPKPVDPDSLGGRIRAARERLTWTTKRLGDEIGVSDVTITHIENGITKSPDRPTLEALARALKDDLGEPALRTYLERLKHGTLLFDEEFEQIIEFYRKMPPEVRVMAVELMGKLESGEILVTGQYDAKKASKKGGKKRKKK